MLSSIDELNLMSSLYSNFQITQIKQDNKKDYTLIYAFIAALLLDYNIVEEKLNMVTAQKAYEIRKANELINEVFSKQIKTETKKVTEILKDSLQKLENFRNKQTSNVWKVSNKDVQKILNATIEGKNYSDRIYDNKNKVAKLLKKLIKDFVDGKISANDIKTIIQKKFNTNDFDTNRLVENEISRVCRELDEQYFKDNINDIDELVYNGVLDSRICEHCFKLDGTTYKVNDVNRPKTPAHVSCRCFYSIKYKKKVEVK
ncbi:MAG: minor capsid protein [Bacillota bacterium]|nr:minor capsid protein [Bacillota bacterium]